MKKGLPLVSVLTPVYNGARYLAECIESVRAQSYGNWEYIIVDNRSDDASAEIARRFAAGDRRIRLVNNATFVDVIENHNIAFGLISPESRYCKVVAADDWLYPECLQRMVDMAERHPSVGIVGSYAILEDCVNYLGLPLKREFFPGPEACRVRLLGASIFGSPTSVLFRSDLVRAANPFFAGRAPNADIDVFFRLLQRHDFGFVHHILSFIRTHRKSVSAELTRLYSFLLDDIGFTVRYGPLFLTGQESAKRLEVLLDEYYQRLADNAVGNWERRFWKYQQARMAEIGIGIKAGKLSRAIAAKVADAAFNPKSTCERIIRRMKVKAEGGGGTEGGR